MSVTDLSKENLNNSYLLSIAIPTYKRPELLEKLIDSIWRQQNVDFSSVQVVIADDSLSEINEGVYQTILSKSSGPSLKVVKNQENLGIDENIVNSVLESDGRYVWLIGEDDLLVDGALRVAVDKLSEDASYPFYFANYIYTDGEHRKTSRSPVVKGVQGEVAFREFSSKFVPYLGFIGGCILNREAWTSTNYKKFSGTFYSHVGGIIDSCENDSIFVFPDVMVLNRAEDVNTFTWSDSTFEVYFSFYDMLSRSDIPNDSHLLYRQAASSFFRVNDLIWLVAKRADGVYSKDVYKKYYKNNSSIFFKLIALFISVIPISLVKPVRKYHLSRKFS